MPVILYGVGALTFAIGIVTVGFGIPNNEFGIGNTLIVAGVTGCAGGLIVISLGVVVAQLRRIAEALGTRTPVRTSRQFETFEPAAAQPQAGQARVPFPPRPKAEAKSEAKPDAKQEMRPDFRPEAEPAPRDEFAPEPRREPPVAPPPPLPFREAASDYFVPHLPNPDEPPVTVADEAYLSPLHPAAPPPLPPFFRVSRPAAKHEKLALGHEKAGDDHDNAAADRDRAVVAGDRAALGAGDRAAVGAGDRAAVGAGDKAAPDHDKAVAHYDHAAAHYDHAAADYDQAAADYNKAAADYDRAVGDRDEHVPPRGSFDAMWPAEPKAPETRSHEPRPAASKPAELSWPEPRRSEQNFGRGYQGVQPPADEDRNEALTGRQPGEAVEPSREEDEPRAVAILKSGVVDGMGYTLYVDGSIEAELPQGTLRFASINELRSHLEKTS